MYTKIYGTIGPACQDRDMLIRLFEEGMTGIRLNLSHTNLKDAAGWIDNIHKAYQSCVLRGLRLKSVDVPENAVPEILMDLQGPELRIGMLTASRELLDGDAVTLVVDGTNNLFDPTEIPVPDLIFPYLKEGQEILLDDGKISLYVEEVFRVKSGYAAECKTLRGGCLNSRKSIALPGVVLHTPTLTRSDFYNIRDAKKYGITGVMLPFVRNQKDLQNLKETLIRENAENIRIFAKIENMDGVNQLETLLPYCDEVVIARGDLGNAMPLWKLPVIQARIATVCRDAEKPFMVVTQMLASMEHRAVPTRAEVSDIFRAVMEGASSVMLTGETAAGAYPVEAMSYLTKSVQAAEQYQLELCGE